MGVVSSSWDTISGILPRVGGLASQSNLIPVLYSGSTEYTDGTKSFSRSGPAVTVTTQMTNNTAGQVDVDGSRILLGSDVVMYSTTPGGVSDAWDVGADFICKIALTFTR